MRGVRKRTRWMLPLLFLASISFSFFAGVTNTYACSCVEPPSVKEALAEKDAVFAGNIADIYLPKEGEAIQSSGDPMYVIMNVDESWKGVETSQVIIRTVVSTASCGFPFEKGESYLVYASDAGEFYATGLCDRTTPLYDAQEDLKMLGNGNRDLKTVDYSAIEDALGITSNKTSIWAYAVPLAVLSGVVVWMVLSKRINRE